MPVDIYCMRHGSHIVPVSPMDEEAILKLPENREFLIRVIRKRSLPQHRLYWAVLHFVLDNMPEWAASYPTVNELHDAIKIDVGFVKHIRRLNGEVVKEAKSIAMSECDQDCFQAFFERAMDLISREIFAGADPYMVLQEAAPYAGLEKPRLEYVVANDNGRVKLDIEILSGLLYRPRKVISKTIKGLDLRGIVGEVFTSISEIKTEVALRMNYAA